MRLVYILFANYLVFKAQAQGDGTTVQTQQGSVAGTLVSPSVRQFLGIPYAIANRWEAPRPPANRTTAFKATNFGDTCPQSLTANFNEVISLLGAGSQSSVRQSENCLSLNIWTPSVSRKQETAVMIWIYGGSFAYGSSNFPYYNGSNFVRDHDDITLVTINYRLNIFGQPNAPQLFGSRTSQNFGLLDQKAAIQWVHANIAAFGGDPNRIILFGESAGSISVDAYTYANPADTVVKGVIQESASLAGNSLLVPQGNISTVASWAEVATSVGCTAFATPFQFACMQLIPFQELENVIITLNAAFAPVPDGVTYFSDINSRSSAGKFLKVPLLIGSNAQEGDLFVVALEQLELGGTIPGLTQQGSDDVTELMFNCPGSITASDRVKAGVPTWRYRYEAIFPNINNKRPDMRAYHFSEVPIVFGTYNSSVFPFAPTAAEVALSSYMQTAWVAFARDPVNGLNSFGWPTYNPSTASLVELGGANPSGAVFSSSIPFDAGCSFTEQQLSLVEEAFALVGF